MNNTRNNAQPDVEELNFGASARGAHFEDFIEGPDDGYNGGGHPRRRRGALKTTLIVLIVLALIAAVACGGGWLWMNRFRSVDITVNGRTVETHINTPVDTVMNDNGFFGAKPGQLLSVSSKVLDEKGGEQPVITVNGHTLTANDWKSVRVQPQDAVTVKSGKDVVEKHTVKRETIPHKKTIDGVDLMGGGAIQYVSQPGNDGYKEQWTGDISKETVDKGVIKQAQDFKVTTKTPRPKDGKKYICLTFDDGPSQYTAQYQKILREKGVKATFFNIGEEAANFGEQEKSLIEDGNEIGSHTVDHAYLPKLSKDALRKEITQSFDTIDKNTGESGRMFRSPYGAFERQQWLDSSDLISMNVLWTIDTEDWRRPGPDKIKNAVLSQAVNGSIVLMHDGGGDRTQDVAALPEIIDGLKSRGFTFVTVSEMIKLDGTFPDYVTNNQPAK